MDLACSDCSARGMASDWLLSLLLGTAVYGSVRTVVWKDGMGSNPMPPIRLRERRREGGQGAADVEKPPFRSTGKNAVFSPFVA